MRARALADRREREYDAQRAVVWWQAALNAAAFAGKLPPLQAWLSGTPVDEAAETTEEQFERMVAEITGADDGG